MFKLAVSIASLALASLVNAQAGQSLDFTAWSGGIYACDPSTVEWRGGQGPYTVSIHNAANDEVLYQEDQPETSLRWLARYPEGTSFYITVEDSQANTISTIGDPTVIIGGGSNTSCIPGDTTGVDSLIETLAISYASSSTMFGNGDPSATNDQGTASGYVTTTARPSPDGSGCNFGQQEQSNVQGQNSSTSGGKIAGAVLGGFFAGLFVGAFGVFLFFRKRQGVKLFAIGKGQQIGEHGESEKGLVPPAYGFVQGGNQNGGGKF